MVKSSSGRVTVMETGIKGTNALHTFPRRQQSDKGVNISNMSWHCLN
jgi:hypothetical protein